MKLTIQRYAIATREYPIRLLDEEWNKTDIIEFAQLHHNLDDAKIEYNSLDDSSEFLVVPIKITYEI